MRSVWVAALSLIWFPQVSLSRSRVVVIGIPDYTANALTKPVLFADHDAILFRDFSVQKSLDRAPALLNSAQATLPQVERELNAALAQAGVADTIYIFISSRGIAWPSLDGYIGTADMVAGKPESGGLPLRFLRKLIEESNAGRVIIFADVSRKPAETFSNQINRRIAELGGITNVKVGGLLATQLGQVSEERSDPKPGYGVFSFSLVNSAKAGVADIRGVYAAVQRDFEQNLATKGKQKPTEFGALPVQSTPLWSASRDAIDEWPVNPRKITVLLATIHWFPGLLAFQASSVTSQLGAVQAELKRSGPVANPAGLAASVEGLHSQVSEEEWLQLQALAIDKLAGDAHRAVDRYGVQNLLPDDPLRVKPDDFKRAGSGFRAALQLVPASYVAFREELTVRQLLCDGLSSDTIDIVPLQKAHESGAVIPEVHNAMGIYYLATDYDKAISEFQEAKKVSPGWMYPRHNLALAFIEKGNYAAAEREYREAIASQPLQPYLYYNLGLLLHRMNRMDEAKAAYQKTLDAYERTIRELKNRADDWDVRLPGDAILARSRAKVFSTNEAEVLNAWGILLDSVHDAKGGRAKYEQALCTNEDLCAARDNWAQLEQSAAAKGNKDAVSKIAISLLDQNLARKACADFHPSLLRRGHLRLKSGDRAGARSDFAEVHRKIPSNTEALAGMAAVDAVNLEFMSAIQLLQEAIAIQTSSGGLAYPAVYVQLAEVQRQANDSASCAEAYKNAIAAVGSGAVYDISARELRKLSSRCTQPAARVFINY